MTRVFYYYVLPYEYFITITFFRKREGTFLSPRGYNIVPFLYLGSLILAVVTTGKKNRESKANLNELSFSLLLLPLPVALALPWHPALIPFLSIPTIAQIYQRPDVYERVKMLETNALEPELARLRDRCVWRRA